MKVDALRKTVKRETKNEKQTSSSSTPKSSPRKNLSVNLKRNIQPIIAQDADVRHLEKDAKAINKILENKDDSRNIKKLKRRSVRNIKNIQRIHIDPLPMIQRKSNNFIEKDQILKLLKICPLENITLMKSLPYF